MKNQGAENVGKILVVGTDGNLILTDMPEGSGDITGVLDDANNILLSGNLADGTYTLKYENEDGTYTEIGNLVVGIVTIPIIWNEGKSCSYTVGSSYNLTDNASYCTSDVIPLEEGLTYTLVVNSDVSSSFRIVGADDSGMVTAILASSELGTENENIFTFSPSTGTTQCRIRTYAGISSKSTWTLTK
jgi:hypothetical protein